MPRSCERLLNAVSVSFGDWAAKGPAEDLASSAWQRLAPLSRRRPLLASAGKREGLAGSADEEKSDAATIYEQQRMVSGLANGALELGDVVDGLMVDFLDDVALF